MSKVLKLKLSETIVGYTDSTGNYHLVGSIPLIQELKDTAIVSDGETEYTVKQFKKLVNANKQRSKKSTS